MRYPGGKGGAGVFHTILRNVPPHAVYIEPFAGGANIFERKARALRSILVEIDESSSSTLRSTIVGSDVEIHTGCGLAFLRDREWQGDEFVYLDPPYVHSTRRSLGLYRHEWADHHHAALLAMLARVPVPWALSGYRSALYDDASSRNGWRRIDFPAMSRGGPRVESLWMNYGSPAAIADPAYAGQDFRDRQRIKRKAERWVARFDALPPLERQAILERLRGAGVIGALTDGAAGSSGLTLRSGALCR